MNTITPGSPCEVTVTPGDNGSISVDVFIPTYSGGQTFTMNVERADDDTWRLFLPLLPVKEFEGTNREIMVVETEDDTFYEVANGIVYLGAPDTERWNEAMKNGE